MTQEEVKKELATLKRKAVEIASKIHDVVEDKLWSEYESLLPLSEEVIDSCKKYLAFKKEHRL